MIALTYAKQILNALFHTGGSAGITAEQELQNFLDEKLVSQYKYNNETVYGISAVEYGLAFTADGNKTNGKTTDELNARKSKVSALSDWYYTAYTDLVEHKYKVTKDDETKEYTVNLKGWYLVKRDSEQAQYPKNTYLALFTEMPDETGSGYKEPIGSDGTITTYMRTNLHCAIITGNECLNIATNDEEVGGSLIDNREIVMFPEVVAHGWGNIVGFGIFQQEDVMTGSPILWGRLKNENGIDAEVDHVPLFRIGDFRVTLQ